jgi:hypothetical protein
MASHRNADKKLSHIDYCLQQLGIRVWAESCQLIAKGDGNWGPLGPKWDLPIEVPQDATALKTAGSDTLRLTAWQYRQEHPGTDLSEVLSQRKNFSAALNEHDEVTPSRRSTVS